MKAVYCDKCGKLFKENEIQTVKFEGMVETPQMDLCLKCIENLEKWLM